MMRHARRATLLTTLLLAAPGCLVSFDGYELDESASAANGGAGAEGGGGGQGGNGAAGSGAVSGSAGSTSGSGGAAAGGSAGSSSGAQGGMGGSPGGSGGVGAAGAGAGGSGGSAAAGGTSGTGAAGGSTGATGGTPTGGTSGTGATGGAPTGGSSGMGVGGSAGTMASGGSAGTGAAGGSAGTMGMGGSAATGGTSTGGSAGTGAAGGTGGTGGVVDCPNPVGTGAMVKHDLPGGGFFCIDKYEVTNSEYRNFVESTQPPSQPPECSWNTNFAPEAGNGCSNTDDYEPDLLKHYPVTCIDWCDAHAYCEWAGKRLCGAITGGGLGANDFDDPGVSQWHASCTINGARTFPYGNTYVSDRCNDLSSPFAGPAEVTSFDDCTGGFPAQKTFHMSGNVQEWENACTGSGASANCHVRGGYWLHQEATASCASDFTESRSRREKNIGFRCCSGP